MASSSGAAGSGDSAMSAEDKMRDEIARLTATINQHKYGYAGSSSYNTPSYGYSSGYGGGYRGRGRGRGGMPGAGPHKQYVRPGLVNSNSASGKGKENAGASIANVVGTSKDADGGSGSGEEKTSERKEVIIGGVAFEASKRSLVRKDLAKSKAKAKKAGPPVPSTFMRKGPHAHGHPMSRPRIYKPKGRPGRNMTLDNTNRTYAQSKKATIRKIDKPCSRFTKTGTCPRGLTCPYQHDPNKIAICWKFMQGDCPETTDTCNLSHNPIPERTPLCVHFLNRGRCTKEKCLFPHVNVGKKNGVCKDFAVLGYCEKGVDCDKNHVRECPEFEETGECRTKGCKLPHVIKANAKWAKKGGMTEMNSEAEKAAEGKGMERDGEAGGDEEKVMTAESAQLGDEYISLIFNESESESEEEEEDEEDEDEDEESDSEMEVNVD